MTKILLPINQAYEEPNSVNPASVSEHRTVVAASQAPLTSWVPSACLRLCKILCLCALLALGLARPCQAQTPAYQFATPPGWTQSMQGDTISVVPTADAQTAAVNIYPPFKLAADASVEFNNLKDLIEKTLKLRAGSVDYSVKSIEVDGAPLFLFMGHYQTDNGPIFMLVAGRADRGAFGLMTYMTGSAQTFQKYLQTAMGLIGGVRMTEAANGIANAGAAAAAATAPQGVAPALPPSPAAAWSGQRPREPRPNIPDADMASPSFTWGTIARPSGSAGLNGIYRYLGANPDGYAFTGLPSVLYSYWTFLPDGRFFARLPDEGMENFNLDYFRSFIPESCGTYALNGSNGVLRYDDSQHTTAAFKSTAQGVYINGSGPYTRIDSVDGWRLDGTYRVADWQSNPYHKGIYFHFTQDGQFEDSGAMQLLGSWLRRSPAPNLYEALYRPISRGTYDIRNNSLSLYYDDGRRRRIAISKSPRTNTGEVFMIDNWGFVRVN